MINLVRTFLPGLFFRIPLTDGFVVLTFTTGDGELGTTTIHFQISTRVAGRLQRTRESRALGRFPDTRRPPIFVFYCTLGRSEAVEQKGADVG